MHQNALTTITMHAQNVPGQEAQDTTIGGTASSAAAEREGYNGEGDVFNSLPHFVSLRGEIGATG